MSEKLRDSSGLELLSRYTGIQKLSVLKNAREIEFGLPEVGYQEVESSKHTDGLETAPLTHGVTLVDAAREDRFNNYMMTSRYEEDENTIYGIKNYKTCVVLSFY